MSNNLKIGLVFGVLLLLAGAGFGYYQYAANQIKSVANQVENILPSFVPSTSSLLGASLPFATVDDLVDSVLSDVSFESGLSSEEFSDLDQDLLLESQAVSEFGQTYDSAEL